MTYRKRDMVRSAIGLVDAPEYKATAVRLERIT
jgi:hypothetical protein